MLLPFNFDDEYHWPAEHGKIITLDKSMTQIMTLNRNIDRTAPLPAFMAKQMVEWGIISKKSAKWLETYPSGKNASFIIKCYPDPKDINLNRITTESIPFESSYNVAQETKQISFSFT